MSIPFGDAEPEDAWQADDPVPVLLDNLRRRAALIASAAVLDLGLTDSTLVMRMFLLADHLGHVLNRIGGELDAAGAADLKAERDG